MATSDLKVRVSADTNSARSELTQISQQLIDMNRMTFTKVAASFDVVTMAIKEVKGAIGKVISTTKEWVDLYSTQQINEVKLQATIRATGSQYELSSRQMKSYAAELQKATRFGDEAIIEAQSLLVATQKLNKEGIERTLSASADLAEALGTDITGAAQKLGKSLADPAKGLESLREAGITFTAQEKEQIKQLQEANRLYEAQAIVLEKVESSYGGTAKAIADIDPGKLTQIKNVWGDIKENLGKGLLNTISPALDTLYNRLNDINDLVDRMVNPNKEKKAIISALESGGSLSEWSTDELSAWGNAFLADRNAFWADNPSTSKYSPYTLKGMSSQQMWETYNEDLTDAVATYFQYEGYWDAIVAEISRRMQTKNASDALSLLKSTVVGRTGADMDAETWLLNLVGEFDVPALRTSSRSQSGAIVPYYDNRITFGKLDATAPQPIPVETANEVAARLRAQTIVNYYQEKGRNSQAYYERLMASTTNSGFLKATPVATGAATSPEAPALTLEELAARGRAKTIVDYYQEKGKNSQSYYERMRAYYANGANQDKTGTSYVWEAPAEQTYSAIEDIKDHLTDLASFSYDTFKGISSSLSDVWTTQANNIKKQMESLRESGSLTLDQEESMTKKMSDLNRRAFAAKQLNAVAEATTSWATGTMNIWKEYAAHPAVAGVMTALLTGTYGAQLATINAQQYTPFAKGGIVTGPTLGLVGEAGPEAIIPLKSQTAERMLTGNGVTVVVNGNVYGDAEQQIFRAIERAQRTGALPSWRYA